jgi:hypothetical protein
VAGERETRLSPLTEIRNDHLLLVGRTSGDLPVTESVSDRLLRPPLWIGLGEHEDFLIQQVKKTLVDLAC